MSHIPTSFPIFTVPEGPSLQNVFGSGWELDQLVSEVATRAINNSDLVQESSVSEAVRHQDPCRLPYTQLLEFLTYLESRSMGSIVSYTDAQEMTDINEHEMRERAFCASPSEVPRDRSIAPVFCMSVGLNELYRKIRAQADDFPSVLTNGLVQLDQVEGALDFASASEEVVVRKVSLAPTQSMTEGVNPSYQKTVLDIKDAPRMYAIPHWMAAGEIPKQFNTSIGLVRVRSKLGQGVYGTVYGVEIISARGHGQERSLIRAALKINKYSKHNYKHTVAYERSLRNEYSVMKHLGRMDEADAYSISRTIDDVQISESRYGFFQKLYNSDLYKEVIAKDEPVSFQQVYHIAHQLFRSLQFFQSVDGGPLIHCDLKPENILIENKEESKIRIADFGIAKLKYQQNAGRVKDYIVSRYYRAPELLLGRLYGPKIDQWSVACILFEIIAKQPLFPAENSNELGMMFIRLLGPMPSRIIEGGTSVTQAAIPIEESLQKENEYTSSVIKRKLQRVKLELANPGIPSDQIEVMNDLFADLLSKILNCDPDSRIGLQECLDHPFMRKMEELSGK